MESGAALITAVCIIALASLLVLSIVTVSQTSHQLSTVSANRASAGYLAEGAVARTIWMLRHDISVNPNRLMARETVVLDEPVERFFADGKEHVIEGESGELCRVEIFDAVAGVDISGNAPAQRLQRPQSFFDDDMDSFNRYKLFLNCVTDYVDLNDFLQVGGGFEREDYAVAGMAPLPRNAQMQFREEIMWVPGCSEFFMPDRRGVMSQFRVIPPSGLPRLRGNSSFFSQDAEQIRLDTGLSAEQSTDAVVARKKLIESGIPLSESLMPDVLGRLRQRFSFRESGFYTIIVSASNAENLDGRVLYCIMQITRNISNSTEIQYYEWRFLQ
ncbi:MAG: hypothetical protein JW808_08630 [Victivallales bacterium]|nr:hypothetical protein [Victivallales bacterium]